MKRKIDKYPYDNSKNLSEVEAIDNMVSAIDYLLELTRNYGPTTIIRIALIALSGNLIAFADLDTAPSPTLNPVNGILVPASNVVFPATKELLGIAAVGLICAAAVINPVTPLDIAACALTIGAKTANEL